MKYNDYPTNGDAMYEKLTKEYQNYNADKVETLKKPEVSPLKFLKEWQKNAKGAGRNLTEKIVNQPNETEQGQINEEIIFKNKNKPYGRPNNFKPTKSFGEDFRPEKSCQIFEMEIDAKLTEIYENLKESESYLSQMQKFNTSSQITTQDFTNAIEKTKIHKNLVKDMCGCDMYYDDCERKLPYCNNNRDCVRNYCSIEFNIINTLLFLMFLKGANSFSLQIKEIVEDRMKMLQIPFSFF